MCIDDVVPTVTVHTYPNQKPWITGNICTELKGRAAAFKERDSNPEAYKKSRYARQRTIKQAKHQYRTKIEWYYTGSDARWMWQGLQTITDSIRDMLKMSVKTAASWSAHARSTHPGNLSGPAVL